tara:strand:+ start:321 stop:500 length:180 start_codon:yes stop_codon:yes gene_type:complete
MSASKKEKTKSTPVEQKKETVKNVQTNVQNKIIEKLDEKFSKLAELERRLKKIEERMGL